MTIGEHVVVEPYVVCGECAPGTSVGFPAESAYGGGLHDALEGEGIRVAQRVVPGGIPKPSFDNGIDDVAERLWQIHDSPGPFRTMLIPLEDGRE